MENKDTKSSYDSLVETPVLESAIVVGGGNMIKVSLEEECMGAEGYDFVISANENCIKEKDYLAVNKNVEETETVFQYVPAGTYYIYCHAWYRDEDDKKVFGGWSEPETATVTVTTPGKPKVEDIETEKGIVTVSFEGCENADGYDIVLGTDADKVNGEKRPVNFGKLVKKNIKDDRAIIIFENVKNGTYYVGIHAYNFSNGDERKVFGPWSGAKKIKVK